MNFCVFILIVVAAVGFEPTPPMIVFFLMDILSSCYSAMLISCGLIGDAFLLQNDVVCRYDALHAVLP